MGTVDSVSELEAYRARDRTRRVVVANITLSSDTDNTFDLSASDLGLDSIENLTFETPFVNGGSQLLSFDRENDNIEARDVDGTDNTADLSGEDVIARVVGPVA